MRRPAVLLIAFLALSIAMPALAKLFLEAQWFSHVQFGGVFFQVLRYQAGIALGVGVISGLVLYVSIESARRNCRHLPHLWLRGWRQEPPLSVSARINALALPGAMLGGLLLGIGQTARWQELALFIHAQPFGQHDPVFGRDIGFFAFSMPLLEALRAYVLALLALTLVATLAVYGLRGAVSFGETGLHVDRAARRHLLFLLAAGFAGMAFDSWLQMLSVVFDDGGQTVSGGYADIMGRLPAWRILIAVSCACAVAAVVSALGHGPGFLPAIALAAFFLVRLGGVEAYPMVLQRLLVAPNEASKEAPYIQRNILATRRAFALDKVTQRALSTDTHLTADDIAKHRDTIDNVRLWDHEPLLDTFAQIQEIRTYYEFNSVDNDRYRVNGKIRQTMLSVRELSAESLPNRTWINEHFTFTHGYGLTLGPVNRATAEGLPELFIRDIPPVATEGFRVSQPAIYYGELTANEVFVRTKNREFDYPSGANNVYTEYDGKGGVSAAPWLTRLALALRYGSLKVLLSEDLKQDSRVLMHRVITERAQRLAPFLAFDKDPYLVVRDDGSLAWIYDAYTHFSRYPYAERLQAPFRGSNYLRNSVKITIDAYDGSVQFYVAESKDPLLRAWQSVFPRMFRPLDSMPEDLRRHLRYPEDLFRVQAQLYTVYHMESAEQVYNREDQWEIPAVRRGESDVPLEPYYTVMTLPGESDPEFILMLPFSPKRKDNLAAWMVARMDEPHRGSLRVYRFPKDRLVFGPSQVMNRIQQNPEISRQVSLWDQRGSEAVFGTLLVIPVEESLLYVCPLYLRSSGGRIPELKRVVVAYENRIAMEPRLDEALTEIFGSIDGLAGDKDQPKSRSSSKSARRPSQDRTAGSEPGEPARTTATVDVPVVAQPAPDAGASALAKHAQSLYGAALRAQQERRWAAYGVYIEELGKTLKRLNRASADDASAASGGVQP